MNTSERLTHSSRAFVRLVETLLVQRRRELLAGRRMPHAWTGLDGRPEPKTFTYTQFRENVYTSFPRLRRGQLLRLPDHGKVMEIADYLESPLEERNRLLIAAGHATLPSYHSGPDLVPLLAQTVAVLQIWPLPAYVINRDWDLHAINHAMLRLIGLSVAEYAACPPARRNVIDLIFDVQLPLRNRLTTSIDTWDAVAGHHIAAFQHANQHCTYEAWYQQRLARWMTLPGFAERWHDCHAPADAYLQPTLPALRTPYGRLHLRSLRTTVCTELFPQLVSYQPLDAAGWRIFARCGIAHPPLIEVLPT